MSKSWNANRKPVNKFCCWLVGKSLFTIMANMWHNILDVMVNAIFDPIQFWEYWLASNLLPITLAVGITEHTVCGKLTSTGICWQHWRENQKYAFLSMSLMMNRDVSKQSSVQMGNGQNTFKKRYNINKNLDTVAKWNAPPIKVTLFCLDRGCSAGNWMSRVGCRGGNTRTGELAHSFSFYSFIFLFLIHL